MSDAELKRKIYDSLLKWKETSKGSTALLIDGARRVGKSFIVNKFGREEYRSCIMIDFNHVDKNVIDIFENDSVNLDEFFFRLSTFYGIKLYERESVIIFDEVQSYPKARGLVKYLVADRRFDFIETGSLLSIQRNIKDITLPSEEEHISMEPLDFEEFLWAMGDETTMPFLRDRFENLLPSGKAIHRKTMNSFREYMIVGGMPQSVLAYRDGRDLEKADNEKKKILALYRDDVSKYAGAYQNRVRDIFDTIPAQLNKKEKRFILASVNKDARMRTYEDAFMWLADGRIINRCLNSTDPSFGLSMNLDLETQKCYMSDTGLLVSLSLEVSGNTEIYKEILFDKLGINEGMFAENVVAQSLRSGGHKLYFYSRKGKTSAKDDIEIDFLIRRGADICPVEVKSSAYNKHASLDKFSERFKGRIGQSYILYQNDVKTEGGIVFLPIYMAMLL